MSKPIAATPKLNVKESERFLDLVEDGLKHPVGPVPTPKLPKSLKDLLENMVDLDPEYSKVVDRHFWSLI